EMALPKDIQRNILREGINHVDLLIVRRGERVTVEVPVEVIGEVAPEHTYVLDVITVPVEADALDLPDSVTIDLTDRKAGEHVYAPDVVLPEGVNIELDEEYLIATVDLVVEQDLGEETDEEADEEVPTVDEETTDEEEYATWFPKLVERLIPPPVPYWWWGWAIPQTVMPRPGTISVTWWSMSQPPAISSDGMCIKQAPRSQNFGEALAAPRWCWQNLLHI